MGKGTGGGWDCSGITREQLRARHAHQRFSWGFASILSAVWQWRTVGIKFKYLDHHTDMHYHKWNAFVLIFGSYLEEREGVPGHYLRTWYNNVFAFRAHRVTIRKPVLMIYFHGPVINHDHKNYRSTCD